MFDVLVDCTMPLLQVIFIVTSEDPAARLILEFYAMLEFEMGWDISKILYPGILELYEIYLFVALFFVVKDHLTEHNELPFLKRVRFE